VTLLSLLAISFVGLLCETGCRRRPASEPNRPASMESLAAASEANQVAVKVNGVPITNGQVDTIVQERLKPFAERLAKLPPEFEAQRRKEKRHEVIEEIVIKQLLDEQVREHGIAVSEEEVRQAIADMASKQQPPMSSEEFLAKVQAGGRTLDGFRKELSRDLGHLRLCERQWAGKTDVSEQEARAYYDQHASQEYQVPEMVRASQILIKPDPQADPNQAKARAKARAEELLAQIRNGADFAELARAHSACPSAAKGGDLGYFKRGDMEAPFEKAAFELAPGQVSGAIETPFGFHIIKVVDRKSAQILTFEEARPAILDRLTAEKRTQVMRGYVESLRSKAKIEYGAE
jgi:peptidyl-prolyl cis-trans isomerase C